MAPVFGGWRAKVTWEEIRGPLSLCKREYIYIYIYINFFSLSKKATGMPASARNLLHWPPTSSRRRLSGSRGHRRRSSPKKDGPRGNGFLVLHLERSFPVFVSPHRASYLPPRLPVGYLRPRPGPAPVSWSPAATTRTRVPLVRRSTRTNADQHTPENSRPRAR